MNLTKIAKLAGISPGTFSSVLNGKAKERRIAQKTVDKVNALCKKHSYVPNIHAQALRMDRSFIVGVISQMLKQSFFADILEGVIAVLEAHDLMVAVSVVQYSDEATAKAINRFTAKKVDGLILVGDAVNIPADLNIPLVSSSFLEKSNQQGCVINAEAPGIKEAIDHLYELGHRRLCVVERPLDPLLDCRVRLMVDLAKQKMDEVVVVTAEQALSDLPKNYSAALCVSDEMAVELINGLQQQSVNVPADVSVIGFDDLDAYALCEPRLSTVKQAKKELGERMALHLLDILKDGKGEELLIPTSLIERKTTAVCRV